MAIVSAVSPATIAAMDGIIDARTGLSVVPIWPLGSGQVVRPLFGVTAPVGGGGGAGGPVGYPLG